MRAPAIPLLAWGEILTGLFLSVLQKPGQLISESNFFALGMKVCIANRCGIWDKRLTKTGNQAHNRKALQMTTFNFVNKTATPNGKRPVRKIRAQLRQEILNAGLDHIIGLDGIVLDEGQCENTLEDITSAFSTVVKALNPGKGAVDDEALAAFVAAQYEGQRDDSDD